jgi:hypothetical protein
MNRQVLFERLEAENAQLRNTVVNLMLQIQVLRDGNHEPTKDETMTFNEICVAAFAELTSEMNKA